MYIEQYEADKCMAISQFSRALVFGVIAETTKKISITIEYKFSVFIFTFLCRFSYQFVDNSLFRA